MKTGFGGRVIWLAEVAMVLHFLLAVMGMVWALLIKQPGFGALLGLLFGLALVLFVEWKNGG